MEPPNPANAPHRLEALIKEQNALIKRLRSDLLDEKLIVQSLKQQCHHTASVEEELKNVKAFLSKKGLEEVSEKAFQTFNTQLQNCLRLHFEEEIQKIKLRYEKVIEKLESRGKEEMEVKDTVSLNLIREINSLYNALLSFKQKTQSSFEREDAWTSEEQLKAVSDEFARFQRECQGFSTIVSSIGETLTELFEREQCLKSELYNLKTKALQFEYQCQKEISVVPPVIKGFVNLEHSLSVCNHDKERISFIDISKKTAALTDKGEISYDSGDKKQSSSVIASCDKDSLLSYVDKLNNYIKDMVHFYESKFCKSSIKDELSNCFEQPFGNLDNDVLQKSDSAVSRSEKSMTDVKECHRMILTLNQILKSYDIQLDATQKRNRQLEEDIENFKQNHLQRVFSLESHIKLLNEKIAICLRENKALELKFQEMESLTVSKQQYDMLETEKDTLVKANQRLEEQVQTLNQNNSGLHLATQNTEKNSLCNATGDGHDKTFNFLDFSTGSEKLILTNVVTSTPFHRECTSDKGSDYGVLKTSLMEWIGRCRTLESDKKELEQKFFNVSFLSNLATCRKNILEQEVKVLRTSIKSLENKLKDYISLKEKCHVLENDNIILNIKNKYLDKLVNCEDNRSSDTEPQYIHLDNRVCTSSFHTPQSAFNCIDEFHLKNQKILFLESKCRSKDARIQRLNLKVQLCQELETSLKSKLDDLTGDNLKMYEKLCGLLEDHSRLKMEKRESEIQLESVRDQLRYCTKSSSDPNKNETNHNLIQAMKDDAAKFLEDCLVKWSEMEERSPVSKSTDRLDGRHCLDILIQDNNLLRSDKEELLLKLTSLQHQFHSLQKNSDVADSGWYLELDKWERELKSELEEQRKQHNRMEDAISSTVELKSLLSSSQQEVSSLKKKLEEETQKTKCYRAEAILLENELKDKEKFLQEVIKEKGDVCSRLAELEKGLAGKRESLETELLKEKWANRLHRSSSILAQVKGELSMLCEEVSGWECRERQHEDEWDMQKEGLDAAYRESLKCLRYLLQEERSRALAEVASDRRDQVQKLTSRMEELVKKVEFLEGGRIPGFRDQSLGPNERKTHHFEVDRERLNKELRELESRAKLTLKEENLFTLIKEKLENYFEGQLNASIHQLKEELNRGAEVRLRAAEELHQEELILLKLTMESETDSKLRSLAEDQLKREKNLMNNLIQKGPKCFSSILHRFKTSITCLLLHYLQTFSSSWEKSYCKDFQDLEKRYNDYLNKTSDLGNCDSAAHHHLDHIENLVNSQNSTINNASNLMSELEKCLSHILESAKDFVRESGSELKSTVEKLRRSDSSDGSAALHHQVQSLRADTDRLREEQMAAVGLLVKDHDEELLRIGSLVNNLKQSGSIENERLVDEIRSELETKHVKELEELRGYYEQKCCDLEKIFSEEVVSQHSCRMSMDSSCSSEGEMISEENTFDPPFVATLIVTDSSVCGNPVGSDLISELYSGEDMVRGLPVNRYFVHWEAMDQVLLKHKIIVDKVEARWRDRTQTLLADLEKNCSERLQSDRDIDRLVADIRSDYSKELNWINVVKGAEALEQSFKSEAEKEHDAEMTRLEDEFEARLQREVENLTRSHKKREMEAVWEAQVQAEEIRRQELHSLDSRWEKKYVDDMASCLTRSAIVKVEFENGVKAMLEHLEGATKDSLAAVEGRLAEEASRLRHLAVRLSHLSTLHSDLLEAKRLYAIEKDVIQKNCDNIILQTKLDAKQNSDLLKSMYQKELAEVEESHRKEMRLVNENLKENKEETMGMQALTEMMHLILDYVEKAIEGSSENGLISIPSQLLPLEKLLRSRVSRVLDGQALKHSQDLDNLRRQFLSKLENFSKISDEDKDSDSLRSVCCQTWDSELPHQDVDQLIKERDSLRKLSGCLKSAVDQLTCYLRTCEEEVNRTVVEQLIKRALSPQDSPVRVTGKERRVHFAPDVSKILDNSYSDFNAWDISLGDPDISLKLKNELESCLSELRKETADIFRLSVSNRRSARLPGSVSTLTDMARDLLADKSPPSATILNVIEELSQEGDRLIQLLEQEKEDLQQQMSAADKQLRSTRQFLDDQATEREAERDTYSRELSLLQAKQNPYPDSRYQALASQVEDLEKQVLVSASDLNAAEENKKALESELKDATEKMRMLTDIINKLESQLMVKSDREECLEKKLDELESELEQQSLAQQAMANEMESLKSRESEETYMDQISALQEELKLQYSSTIIRNIKSQLREIERNVADRTKELETFNLDSSANSLSSPSEEISIREHLEMLRSHTPEQCPSPVALPVEEVNRLHERVQRHSRAEDMLLKKIKEQDLRISKLSSALNEVEAEREVLQQTVDKLSSQLGRANSKADELRRKAEAAHTQAGQAAAEKIAQLENEASALKRSLDQAQSQLEEKESQVERAKQLIEEQNVKLSSSRQQVGPEVVQALRLQLASTVAENNRLCELVEKYRNEAEVTDMSPLYSCLLSDKNEDIQQLQRTVNILQNQQQLYQEDEEVSQECVNRGVRKTRSVSGKAMSFAEELSPIGRMESQIRDAPHSPSLPTFSLAPQGHTVDKTDDGNKIESQYEGPVEPTLSPGMFGMHQVACPGNQSIPKDQTVSKLESEVKNLRSLVVDLTDAKQDVESYISSFTDDRKYYECQLDKLLDEKRAHEMEIEKLRRTLVKKDDEIESTSADVTKLQSILSNLQEKLKRASDMASKDNDLKKELSEMKEKCLTLEDALDKFYKFREDLGSINDDFKFHENNGDYFQNILNTLRQKLRKTTDIELSNGNLKRHNDDLKNKLCKLQHESETIKQDLSLELSSLKSELNTVLQDNDKLKRQVSNYLQLKEDKTELETEAERLRLRSNLMEVELDSLKTENNKLVEELESLRTEVKFKVLQNNLEHLSKERDSTSEPPPRPDHVPDLEDLTHEIEKQLDLSVKLDNSLLNTIGDKSYQKKEAEPSARPHSVHQQEEVGERRGNRGTGDGLVDWLAREVDAWQAVGSKQHELTSQLSNLSRLAQTQDNRITRLLVELDSKKKECLVMELELLRERSGAEEAQRQLETERHRASALHKEDTHLIEMLRVRLEGSLKAESHLKTALLEERRRHDDLEARLNSARALETYIQASESGESSRAVREGLMLRLEVDRLKQVNSDLEQVIARERNYQASLKDKLKLVHVQSSSSEKQTEELKVKLIQEIRLRESMEEQLRIAGRAGGMPTPSSPKHDVNTGTAMNNLLTEIKDWKEECMQLRDCIRLQREHEDYWTANVQTPLIKQLHDVNRSLESLVREKISLQTYVNCIEKERDFLRSRVEKLEEINEKLCGPCVPLSPQTPYKLNVQPVVNKLTYLAEANHRMEKHSKALVWQKRFLQHACDGYKRMAALTLDRLEPAAALSTPNKKKPSFRCVVHVVRACIKFTYIQRQRKASRRTLINRIRAEVGLLQPTSQPFVFSDMGIVGTDNIANNNCTNLSPPSQYLYAVTKLSESGVGPLGAGTEASKLSQYITMFDQMQKRLGKIIQNDNI